MLLLSIPAMAATLVPDLRQLDAVPMHSLPALAMQKAVASAVSKNRPLQFAVSAALPLTLADGVWQQIDANTWSWRTRVYSANAQTLNFHFAQFRMPEGGALWLYDPSGRVTAGPYTQANETGDGQLWTAVVMGETAIIEARVPAAGKDQLQLALAEANHGYRGFGKTGSTGSFNASGACEIDVACPVGQPWLTQARALARITISGNTLCSGQLVNNVRQDNTPFFLTANHCGITSATASSVVFYWNYQNSVCGGNGTEPSYQTQSGSNWVAGDVTSDFTLIETAQQPQTSFNLYFAGWNAGSDIPQSGAVVDHPEGDVTKVAIYDTPATRVDNVTLCDGGLSLLGVCLGTTRTIDVWQVSYSQGITEPGSSGSALYDQNQLIVGQLSGGTSACSGTSGNGMSDVYGRTEVAWTANAAASGQLKANLDPDNTGTVQLGGKNVNSSTIAPSMLGGLSNGEPNGTGGGSLDGPLLALLFALALFRRLRPTTHC
jgi:hypothetical protein